MLTVKLDTYADVAFADEYIARHNEEYAPLRVHWSVLTEEEKEEYLRMGLAQIEKLVFVGRKYLTAQPLQFPRRRENLAGLRPPGYPFFAAEGDDIPEEVAAAQTENALGILNERIIAICDKQFMTMQALGAVKNTKYNKREAEMPDFAPEVKKTCELASEKAYRLLRSWMGGVRC